MPEHATPHDKPQALEPTKLPGANTAMLAALGSGLWTVGVLLGHWWLGLLGLAVLVAQTAWWGSLWGVVLLVSVSIFWTPQVWPVAWPAWMTFVATAGIILAPLAIIRQAPAEQRRPARHHAP